MKILQLIQKPQLRGAEIFACQLAEELIAKGFQVDIVHLFHDQQGLKEKFPTLNFINLQANRTKRFVDVRAYRKLHHIILQGGYTIVQANAGDTLKYAALSKLLFRWKAKLVFRNANLMRGFLRNGIHRMLTRFFLRQCDYVISVSENCRVDICSIDPGLKSYSKTVSIGTYLFDAIQPVQRYTTEPIWINIGAFVSEKNHQFLIDSFFEFYQHTGRGYLWLVGDGPLRKVLEERIVELKISDRVKFWGYARHAVAILKSADVLVMPSKVEGLPGVILEALSCKIPVVAAAVGGIPEVITDQETGICISGYTSEQYMREVEKLLGDRLFRNKITEKGFEQINRHYLLPQVASKFLDVYSMLSR